MASATIFFYLCGIFQIFRLADDSRGACGGQVFALFIRERCLLANAYHTCFAVGVFNKENS